MKKNKTGFTLVELSIALVIIGLLIGGILVGQSMIGSAKVNATIQQLSQFDAKLNSFKSKFNQLPGDSKYHGGDGDGVIEFGGVSQPWDNRVYIHAFEIANFWNQLDSKEFPFSSAYTAAGPGSKATTSGPSKSVPAAKMVLNGAFWIASSAGEVGSSADSSNPRNSYTMLNPNQAQTISGGWYRFSTLTTYAAKPIELLSLDKKLDDGVANQGLVYAGYFDSSGMKYLETAACSTGTAYDIDNDNFACTPIVRMGTLSGNYK